MGKQPAKRRRNVNELIVDLRGARKQMESGAKTGPSAPPKPPQTAPAFAWAAVIAVALVLSFAAWLATRPNAPDTSWAQITRLPDSATSPALSPDGRMLTFIRGASTFYGPGEIYVKRLPGGEASQLTHDGLRKMSPVFSPDGSRIAYTVVDPNFAWDTWVVPVTGGEPSRWLPNASGLIWNRQRLLFSEIKQDNRMALVTASENRAEARDLYLPPGEQGRVHRSYPSPNARSVLLVEMDRGVWLPCRVIPTDGSSPGRTVGPPGQCTHGAWSPDGNWVYLSANAGNGFHIWRQRFPAGQPEQLTFGPTEEEGLAMGPNGRWLLTAAATIQGSLWLRDDRGDRKVSAEGFAFLTAVPGRGSQPFSADGKRLHFLCRPTQAPQDAAEARSGELWVAQLDSGRVERLITGFDIIAYDISPDQTSVAFAALGEDGKSQVWVAPLDRRTPPTRLDRADAASPHFGPDGEIFFSSLEDNSIFIYRVEQDGTGLRKAVEDPIFYFQSISPGGQWLVATVGAPGEESPRQVVAFPAGGGSAVPLCIHCNVNWTPDNSTLHLILFAPGTGEDHPYRLADGATSGMEGSRTVAISLPAGKVFPPLPPEGIRSEADLSSLPGVRFSEAGIFYPGPDPEVYAYSRESVQRNIYRIPIP